MDRLRKNRKREYSYRFSATMHHARTQVSFQKGLKQFKYNGEKSISKELLQIHMKITFSPLAAGDLIDK